MRNVRLFVVSVLVVAVSAVFTWSPTAHALNAPVMVKDINPGAGNGPFAVPVVYNGFLYFSANDGVNGIELWRSDGTAAGTSMVKDINPGAASSTPNTFVVYNGFLYFSADDGVNGVEPWRSDGTPGGTALFKDINPGVASSSPIRFTVVNGVLYFLADDGVAGAELWSSDGTPGGTALFKDINPGAGTSLANFFVFFNGSIFFRADDGVNGIELWSSDGTPGGTALFDDLWPGASGSTPNFLTVFNGLFYFNALNVTDSRSKLWASDGTVGGTVIVQDVGDLSPMINYNSHLFFAGTDGVNGFELWSSDGTTAGTALFKDINPGPGNGVNSQASFAIYDNLLYFRATNTATGTELWQTDGTTAGTVMTADINPGAGDSSPIGMVALNGLLYFFATNGTSGTELWSYNDIVGGGTSSSGQLVLAVTVNGGPLQPADITTYINGQIASPGTYTRTNGAYTVTATPVPDYTLSYVGDCAPSGTANISNNTVSCTVTYTYIPTPTSSPTPSISVTPSPSASVTPTPSPSPSASPSSSPTPSPSASVTPRPSSSPAPSGSVLPPPQESGIPPLVPPGTTEQGTPTGPTTLLETLGTVATTTVAVAKLVVPATAPALTAVIAIPVLLSGASAAAASGSPAGFAVSQLGRFLEIVGIKRRRRSWGTLYDSSTKAPISYAKVELKDKANRTLETRFADRSGRYGFLTSPSSLHQESLTVSLNPGAQKYAFPSKVVTTDPDFLVYDHIYKGGPLTIKKDVLVNYNIPLDIRTSTSSPLPTVSRSLFSRAAVTVLDAGFWVGLIAAPLNVYFFPSTLSIIVLSLFILANLFRLSLDLYRPFGLIVDEKGKPLPYSLITLNKHSGERLSFSVSDSQGRYFLLADPGTYTLTVFTPAQVTPPRHRTLTLTTTKGWIREKVRV